MRFSMTEIDGLWIVDTERAEDLRGSFARTFCKAEFAAQGLTTEFSQHSMSISFFKHTLRGLHFQSPPDAEVKLVSCVRGAIFDVAVDLRPDSPTYLHWASAILSPENGKQFYIPEGFAHGFQSLADDTAVSYLISAPYVPQSAAGIRYDEPAIGISWPFRPTAISERDKNWPEWRASSDLSFETEV